MSDNDFGDDEILKEFLIESYENLDQLDQDFIALEQNPQDAERLSAIFRCIHTVKGTCGFFGFQRLESVTHAGENLLSLMRDGELSLTPEITSALLSLVDSVRELLAGIETNGSAPDIDYSALIQTLTSLQQVDPQPDQDESPEVDTSAESDEAGSETGLAASEPESGETDDVASEDDRVHQLGEILVSEEEVDPTTVAGGLLKQLEGDERPLGEILVKDEGVEVSKIAGALTTQELQKSQTSTSNVSDGAIRVDVTLLDKLMNMVGELVLSRNQVLQFAMTIDDAEFVAASQRLNQITSELQEGVMKTRMQQISAVWSKFPRLVRDMSKAAGKQIRLDMEGKDTELDKSILEAIKDPLTHVIRNSVDHGIETPEERERAGKSPEGHLLLRAFHEGGQVIIELIDDGAGINVERVKAKALERGLITQQQADNMGMRELMNLVFLPGFSTAEKVTNISGRGVGMDVVKTNIEKIGGMVDILSEPGKGTTLRIKIPLTLAIIPALIITSEGDRYAIPQVNLLELVRLKKEEVEKRIEMIHGSPVYRLRGNLLPLVYLNEALKNSHKSLEDDKETTEEEQALNIVVLQADDRQFGLIVQAVHDTEEIVVKPLGKQLKDVSVFAGATIMGDGKVALILDVMGLAHASSVISEVRSRSLTETEEHESAEATEQQMVLLFQCGADGRMAIPLTDVARLEEFDISTIERVGNMDVVQYRDEILPLIRVSEVFNEQLPEKDDGTQQESAALQVVVYNENGHNVGLVVESIVDITDASFSSKGQTSRPGVEFTAVINGKVSEFIDVKYVIRSAIPEFFKETPAEPAMA